MAAPTKAISWPDSPEGLGISRNGKSCGSANQGASLTACQSNRPKAEDPTTPTSTTLIRIKP